MKKAVMYGAGNIGRGFLGQLFHQSGYEVVFIDINQAIINKMNQDGSYPIRVVSNNSYEELIVGNIRAVDGRDEEKTSFEIAEADIMATAVGVNVLPHIALPLAKGLSKRWETRNYRALNIIICENMIDAHHYLSDLIKKHLSLEERILFDKHTGMVEASIGRMVPVMTEKMQEGNILRVWVEPYDVLPVDRDGFKGDIPQIKNMVPHAPFDYYIQRKLYMHNMGHATAAYLGFLNNSTFIWEALKDKVIEDTVNGALDEAARAMSIEHNVSCGELLSHSKDLVQRFRNRLLGDTVARVGKDPVRKLSGNDRLVGAARLCVKHGIKPENICKGLAAGYLFDVPEDKASQSIKEFVEKEGFNAALQKFSNVETQSEIGKEAAGYYLGFLTDLRQ